MATSSVWEWMGDNNAYVPYDATFASRVETAFSKGATTAEVAYSGTKYDMDFGSFPMTQTNKESLKVRSIRRTEPLWFYFEDNGKAKPYNPSDSKNLEAAASAAASSNSATFIFNMFSTNYTMDLVKMTQTNPDSGKVRKIARRGGVALLPTVTPASGGDDGAPSAKKAQVETSTGVKKSVAATLCTNIYMPAGATAAAAANNDDDDDDDDDAPAPAASKSTTTSTAATVNYGAGTKSTGNTTTAVMKNGGVVDVHSGLQHSHHIYKAPSGVVFQCMLNQTNIAQNNNKFYVIQLLEVDAGAASLSKYYVFTRWGRVGSPGQQSLDGFSDHFSAMKAFAKKFREKTMNDWDNKDNFNKIPGKYHLMDIDLGGDGAAGTSAVGGAAAGGAAAPPGPIPDSTLPPALQRVMKLISNKTEMTQVMKELKIDTDKMPLGKISKKQIKEAFEYLKQIEGELKHGKTSGSVINNASSMFYTLIPHNFGFAVPPMISSHDLLKEKMKLLEVMGDLEIAAKILNEGAAKVDKNPLDATYASLNAKLTPLDHSSDDFKRVVDYVANTRGPTHKQYKLVVEEVFAVVRPGEADRYTAYANLHNKQMLWHGSRTTNYMGILSQGLRIAPPEAPVTGYMYGKGVYFADCSTKSANYCHTNATNNVGFALLCEVALGTTKDYKTAQYMDKPQPGTNSTRGLGNNAPDPSGGVSVNGVTWPVGKMKPSPEGSGSSLLYPEYIVYDVAQCVMRYMVQLRFDYSSKW